MALNSNTSHCTQLISGRVGCEQRNLTSESMLVTQNNTAFIHKNAKRVIHGKMYVFQMENYIH